MNEKQAESQPHTNIDRDGKYQKSQMGRIGNRPYWVLSASIMIRAIHQLGAAVFITSFLFDDLLEVPRIFLILVMGSGFILIFTEWLRHRQIFRELSGIMTFTKLIIIGAAFHGLLPTSSTMVFAFLLASVGAHAPKQIRHKLIY